MVTTLVQYEEADVGSNMFFDFIRSRAGHEIDSLIAELFQWRDSVKRTVGTLHPDDMMHNLEGVKSEIAMLVQVKCEYYLCFLIVKRRIKLLLSH
jgi:hypothetical protein